MLSSGQNLTPQQIRLARTLGLSNLNPEQQAIKDSPLVYSPDIGGAFDKTDEWNQRYSDAISGGFDPLKVSELADSYKAYGWGDTVDPVTGEVVQGKGSQLLSEYKAPTYDSAEYEMPDAYKGYEYDFANQYEAPDAYQSFDYQMPDIEGIQSVQPMSEGIWDAQAAKANEAVTAQFGDIKQRTRDELIRTGKRPEQAAAIMANLELEEQKARQVAGRDLNIEEAKQNVGIAQTEQSLGAQRGEFSAGMDAKTQEKQAQEMAQKYGMDIDSARYKVQQEASQQQLLAGEGKAANESAFAQTSWKQSVDEANKRFGYETSLEKERYLAAQKQWIAEQEAAESEKQWQSEYGRSQDQASIDMAKWQAENAAKLDEWNATLQGGTQAGQTAAQKATYDTNLTENERREGRNQTRDAAIAEAGQAPSTDSAKSQGFNYPSKNLGASTQNVGNQPVANNNQNTMQYREPTAAMKANMSNQSSVSRDAARRWKSSQINQASFDGPTSLDVPTKANKNMNYAKTLQSKSKAQAQNYAMPTKKSTTMGGTANG